MNRETGFPTKKDMAIIFAEFMHLEDYIQDIPDYFTLDKLAPIAEKLGQEVVLHRYEDEWVAGTLAPDTLMLADMAFVHSHEDPAKAMAYTLYEAIMWRMS